MITFWKLLSSILTNVGSVEYSVLQDPLWKKWILNKFRNAEYYKPKLDIFKTQ